MKQELKDDLKSYEGFLDEKIEKLLNSLDIELEQTIMALRKLKIVWSMFIQKNEIWNRN